MHSNPRIPFALASRRPALPPLDGKRLIVHLVMNIEYWPFDHPMPRAIFPPPHGKGAEPPDVPNFGWVEYGMRCGMPRFMGCLARRGLPASAFMNAMVADVYPDLAAEVVAAGWELVGHGDRQRSLKTVDDEDAVIRSSLDRLEALGGRRPRGWLGPGLAQTYETPDRLKAAGLDFVHDWLVDDLPCWMTTAHGPLLALPYSLELNDVPIWAVQGLSTDELHKRVEATLAVFETEMAEQPRIMTFGLHPHLIGVPHRMYYFEKTLDLLQTRDDTVFVTSSILADWYKAAAPPA